MKTFKANHWDYIGMRGGCFGLYFRRFSVGLFLLLTLSCTCFSSIPQSWAKVGDNGQIALWVETTSGLCKINQQHTNNVWDSLPNFEKQPNDYWLVAYRSVFIIRYATDDKIVENAFSGSPKCKRQFSAVTGGGCRFTFNFTDIQICFTAEYTLGNDNNLRVNIPFDSIKDPKNRLLDIRFLPFFGGVPFQSKGYLVLPDGCGGILIPNYLGRSYQTSRIYGERFSWSSGRVRNTGQLRRIFHLNDYRNSQSSFYNLPMFGIVKSGSCILGVISRGQYQAELGTEVTSENLWLTVSPRLIIREIAYNIFGQVYVSPVFDRIDRTVDYYVIYNETPSYVAIAKKYRQILSARSSFSSNHYKYPKKALSPKQTFYRLRLLMGVPEEYQKTERLLCLTNFVQAEAILKDLHQKGLRNLEVVLVGWTKGGFLGDNPRHFPPDQKFGGNNGLKRLIATGKKLGYSIGLEFDNTFTFRNGHGFKRSDTVKDIQGIPVNLNANHKEYLLCPEIARKKLSRNDLKHFERLQLNGPLVFDGFDRGLFNCYDSRHLIGGEPLAKILLETLATVPDTGGIGITTANDFMADTVSAFYNLPTHCSENCDLEIPLTALIFHGTVPYSFEPLNLRRDNQREFLRMIEYGGVPIAFLTAENVSELKYAKYNLLFNGKYTDWRSAFLKEYRTYHNQLQQLQTKVIIDHRRLAQDVYLTVYEGHTATVVNYSSSPFSYRGIEIKAHQYSIIKL